MLLAIISCFVGVSYDVFAATQGSSVLDDLGKDRAFNASAYPKKRDDYSLKVIHLAESTSGELFLYVYQPSCDDRTIATTVSIAEEMNNADDFSPALYGLELMDSDGVFYKYKVLNYAVSSAVERFYNVIMIQRPFISGIDSDSGTGTTIDRKAFGVGQYWRVKTEGDSVTYEMLEVDVVQIINPFVSRIRKNKEVSSNSYFQDNYYVAFSTDRNIEKLLSATVSYRTRDYFYENNSFLDIGSTIFNENTDFSNERFSDKDIYCDEVIELDNQINFGIFSIGNKYSWQRIQSAADFVANAGASAADNEEVKKLQWVLMFDEVSVYRYQSSGTLITTCEEAGQVIDQVTILRLEFVEDGVTYNLGTVSDTVSGENHFGDGGSVAEEEFDIWKIVLAVLLLVLLLLLLIPIIKGIAKLFKGNKRRDFGGRDLDKMSREEVEKELDKIDWNSDFWKNIDGTDGG